MSDSFPDLSESAARDQADVYPLGSAGATAYWDGQAWQPPLIRNPNRSEVEYQRGYFSFHRCLWFWLVLLGSTYSVLLLNLVDTDIALLGLASFPGFIAVLIGVVLLISRHLYQRKGAPHWIVLWWGIMAGAAASLAALFAERLVDVDISGNPIVLGLQAGLIEETSKLLLPITLLGLGASRFSSPRLGVLLVAVCSATFGGAEAALYLANTETDQLWTLAPRSLGEMSHVLWSSTAAGVIWLAAWRRQRLFTIAGLVGWLAAVLMHAINDAFFVWIADIAPSKSAGRSSDLMMELWIIATAMGGIAVVVGLWFLLSRIAIRELVPPSFIARSSPGWRPRLRSWGSS